MSAETDLSKLLQNMEPKQNPGEYVFCMVESHEQAIALHPIGTFHEKEGITVILPREQADALLLSDVLVCAWITLTVHSSLEVVGLTAAVSQALAEENISCNMVGGCVLS